METIIFTKEELKNLEVIFAYARKLVSDNENELIAIINFKQQLFEKLIKLAEQPKQELNKI